LRGLYQQVKDKRATEIAERAYKLKPDNPAVADTLGWILVEQGSATRAVQVLQKAVSSCAQGSLDSLPPCAGLVEGGRQGEGPQ
jgi:Tfp pilus assembly protein PilF